jgi:hypothetical protein
LKSLVYTDNPRNVERCIDKNTGEFIFPPRAIRRSANEIHQFFGYRLGLKRHKIADLEKHEWEIDTSGMISYLQSEFASPQGQVGDRPTAAATASSSSHLKSTEEKDSDTRGEEEGGLDEGSVTSTQDMCPGITLGYVRKMKYKGAEKEQQIARRVLGFSHVVREGLVTRQQLESPDRTGHKWPFCLPTVACLVSGNDPKSIMWKIDEVEGYKNKLPLEAGPEFDRFIIRHVNCVGGSPVKEGLCQECVNKKKLLVARFDSNVKAREDPFNVSTRSTLVRSFSVQNKKVEHYQQKAS